MSPEFSRLMRVPLILKAVSQLGLGKISLFAWYRLKLISGLLRLQTPVQPLLSSEDDFSLRPLLSPPSVSSVNELLGGDANQILEKAEEILGGNVPLFGGESRPLDLQTPQLTHHWTQYRNDLPGSEDIKPTWETGRFGWAQTLARAYHLTRNDVYARAFWGSVEEFLSANPPNQGPHWSSAQEVALRLISLAFCFSVFANSGESTPSRRSVLAATVAAHADRIPPTLSYARAQNNNHLLSEALGLSTAAALLPEHPAAKYWARLGQKWFATGLKKQIEPNGAYSQHSVNYHRLMLQLGLWAHLLATHSNHPMPSESTERLAAATRWLLKLLDINSGAAPNLGPNDGAYILPLTILPFSDYRPVLQAAGRVFLGERPLPPGPWDEMALWLVPSMAQPVKKEPRPKSTDHPLRLQAAHSWAYLRATPFHNTPGHADQLHLDLWWRGQNIALDAGSYLYTAPQPWDNALAATRVHNTLTLNRRNQMTLAGRFLWLDWAQARIIKVEVDDVGHLSAATAEHNGYRALSLRHQRRASVDTNDTWKVEDTVFSNTHDPSRVLARLHWLLPDWKPVLSDTNLKLVGKLGEIMIDIRSSDASPALSLSRAGKRLAGDIDADPILGWVSPTYGEKQPALSLIASLTATPPFTITTIWHLPN